jgi:Translation initiation factor IF-2, N-terminal region
VRRSEELIVGKTRVHELATEFGVESKVVLARLKAMGEFVKSASSTVEPRAVQKLRDMLTHDDRPSAAAIADVDQSVEGFLGVPERANHRPALRGRPGRQPGRQTGLAAEIARRWPALGDEHARHFADQWTRQLMEKEDVVPWFDAGLGPNEAEIAHALLQHGVLPRHLKIVVGGRSAVTLYRDTRSVERLVATLRGDGHL